MQTTIQEQEGNIIAILEGSLDTAAVPETETAMSPLLEATDKDVIIQPNRSLSGYETYPMVVVKGKVI